MASIDLYGAPTTRRTRLGMDDLYAGPGPMEQPKPAPTYGSFTTGGYQPSDGGFRQPPQTGPGPFGAPTGGINPYGGTFTPTPTPTAQPFSIDALMNNLRTNYGAGTLADFQRAQQEHPDWFAGGTFSGSKGDKFTHSGRTYDMVIASGLGGRGWNGADVTFGGGGGGANTFGGTQEFTDPLTSQYERLAKSRIDQLFNPIPMGPDQTSMVEQARKRAGELNGPAYSPGEREVLRTQFTDPLAAQREAAKKQVVERMAASGIRGGLVERAMQEVDRQYDAMLAANQRQLSQSEIQRGDERKSESMDLQKYLATAEQARIAFQEGRYQDAVALSNQLSQLPERRIQLGNQVLNGGQSPMDVFSAMQSYGNNQFNQNAYKQQQNDAWLSAIMQQLANIFKK